MISSDGTKKKHPQSTWTVLDGHANLKMHKTNIKKTSYLHVPSFQDEVWSTAPWSKSGTLSILSMLHLTCLLINALEIDGETQGVSG